MGRQQRMSCYYRQAVVVILSISSLVAVVIFGLPRGNPANFIPFAPSGFIRLLPATGLIFFAYTGYSRIATLVEEVRTIPRDSTTINDDKDCFNNSEWKKTDTL